MGVPGAGAPGIQKRGWGAQSLASPLLLCIFRSSSYEVRSSTWLFTNYILTCPFFFLFYFSPSKPMTTTCISPRTADFLKCEVFQGSSYFVYYYVHEYVTLSSLTRNGSEISSHYRCLSPLQNYILGQRGKGAFHK